MIDLDLIKKYQTNGINYDVTTQDIINKLQDWDQRLGLLTVNKKLLKSS